MAGQMMVLLGSMNHCFGKEGPERPVKRGTGHMMKKGKGSVMVI
jgi:hypothetical protein